MRLSLVMAACLLTVWFALQFARRADPQTAWIYYSIGDQLYRMQPDGSHPELLTTLPGRPNHLQLSPNNTWFLFTVDTVDSRTLYRLHIGGKHAQPLTQKTEGTDSPAWSPDGQQIAFTTSDMTGHTISLMYADGSHRKIISHYRNYKPHSLSWSQDGQWIYYVHFEYVMRVNLDGSQNLRVVHTNTGASDPRESPHGQSIAYTSTDQGAARVYRLDLGQTTGQLLVADEMAMKWPRWSPNGNWLFYVAAPYSMDNVLRANRTTEDLYIITPEGGNKRSLSRNVRITQTPFWSPDGRWIVYSASSQGQSSLYRVRYDGTDTQRLTALAPEYQTPLWSSEIDLPAPTQRLVLLGFGMLLAASRKIFHR